MALIVIREHERLIAGPRRSAGRRRVYGVLALPELKLIPGVVCNAVRADCVPAGPFSPSTLPSDPTLC
jgi:hypothetical protein